MRLCLLHLFQSHPCKHHSLTILSLQCGGGITAVRGGYHCSAAGVRNSTIACGSRLAVGLGPFRPGFERKSREPSASSRCCYQSNVMIVTQEPQQNTNLPNRYSTVEASTSNWLSCHPHCALFPDDARGSAPRTMLGRGPVRLRYLVTNPVDFVTYCCYCCCDAP